MVEYVTRDEFETRVGVLEKEVEGEKVVSRYILEQARRNGDDIASVRTRLDRVETRLDRVETQLGTLSSDIKGLAKNLPSMMRDAVRDIFKEREKKR